MKNMLKKISAFLIMAFVISVPIFVFADGQVTSSVGLQNPLQFNSLQELIFGVINIVLKFAYVFIAFAIIWAGFKLITAQGKPAEIEKAKSSIAWTLIGAAIIIGANVIAVVLQNTISSFTK